jgi:hypothetical protein
VIGIANPFIRLYEAPVETLTLSGYVLGLAVLLVATLGLCWTNVLAIADEVTAPRRGWTYEPPLWFLARVAAVPLVLMVDVWAVAAVIALLT